MELEVAEVSFKNLDVQIGKGSGSIFGKKLILERKVTINRAYITIITCSNFV